MALKSATVRLSSFLSAGARDEGRTFSEISRHRACCVPAKNVKRRGTFMSMILEAVKGAKQDVMHRKTLWDRIHRGTVLSAVLVREVTGLFAAAPYGLQALSVYRALERHDQSNGNPAVKSGGDDEAMSVILWLVSLVVKAVLAVLQVLLRRSQPLPDPLQVGGKLKGVSLVQDVRYGPAERNVLDVYIPPREPPTASNLTASGGAAQGMPVLLFVHGGVWASGEKWQYAPMAVKCAQEGVVVVAIQYTLFPEALSCSQAQEVSLALTWVLDNVAQFGGDPARVFLSGHSSGAHICALAIWERACAQLRQDAIQALEDAGVKPVVISSAGDAGPMELEGSTDTVALLTKAPTDEKSTAPGSVRHADTRQPHCFLGLSGVYDIAKHLAHEMKRGVDVISCMTPANGGDQGFAQRSPALLLAALSALSPAIEGKDPMSSGSREAGAAAMAAWASQGLMEGRLHGERSKAARVLLGVEDGVKASSADLEAVAAAFGCVLEDPEEVPCKTTALRRVLSGRLATLVFPPEGERGGSPCDAVDVAQVMAKSQAHARQLFPLSVLTCSPGDIVVPPDTSMAYAAELRSLGMPCKLLVYDQVTHSDFACWSLDWSREQMPHHVQDMLELLTSSSLLA